MGELEEHVLRSRLAGRHDAQTFAELVDHGWTPRDVRLALVRASHGPTVHGPDPTALAPGGQPGAASAWSRGLLPAAALLAAVPTVAVSVVALPMLLAVVVIFTGAPAPWAMSTVGSLETVVGVLPWLVLTYLAALVLLIVHLARRRPRDAWGRPAPRPRSSSVLTGMTIGMLAASPFLAVGGFLLLLMMAAVCGQTPGICR